MGSSIAAWRLRAPGGCLPLSLAPSDFSRRIHAAAPQETSPASPLTEQSSHHRHKFQNARVLDFQLTEDQAQKRHEAWNRKHAFSLSSLWGKNADKVRAVQLPFWRFSANVDAVVSKSRGLQVSFLDGQGYPTETVHESKDEYYSFDHPDTQIFASYTFRRDFVQDLALGSSCKTGDLRPLSDREQAAALEAAAGAGVRERPGMRLSTSAQVEWDACSMSPAVAWHLALRNIRRRQIDLAGAKVGTDNARSLQVHLQVRNRKVELVYLPAYFLDYSHGTTINISQERVSEKFQALVAGTEAGGVAGERHFSPTKVQAATGAICSAVFALDFFGSPLLGLSPSSSPEFSLTSTVVLSALSGVAARRAVNMKRQDVEQKIADSEEESYDYNRLHDESIVQRVEENEWTRWEESEKWRWDQPYRKRWAADLFAKQTRRRKDLKDHLRRLQLQQMKEEEEARRQAARERRYGKRSNPAGLEYRRGVDFMGFYRLLGLDDKMASATEREVKEAFRKEAMRLHPDRNKGEQNKKKAEEGFKKIQKAYAVLGDPEKRKLYHKGQIAAD